MKKVIISAFAVASISAVNAQTIDNSGFEAYSSGDSIAYSSEIAEGKNLDLKELTSWKHSGDISTFLDESGKKPNSSLRIGGAEVDSTNSAYTQIRIATAGLYTVSFQSFTAKGLKDGAQALVFLSNSDATNSISSAVFKEASDGALTNQSISFKVDKETIDKFKGSFALGFANGGGKDSRSDMMVDNVSITAAVPEPSSTALLGLGALGLLVRRKR